MKRPKGSLSYLSRTLLIFLFLFVFSLSFFFGCRHEALLLEQKVLQISMLPPEWAMLSLSIPFRLRALCISWVPPTLSLAGMLTYWLVVEHFTWTSHLPYGLAQWILQIVTIPLVSNFCAF
jgi:hypothetical protein